MGDALAFAADVPADQTGRVAIAVLCGLNLRRLKLDAGAIAAFIALVPVVAWVAVGRCFSARRDNQAADRVAIRNVGTNRGGRRSRFRDATTATDRAAAMQQGFRAQALGGQGVHAAACCRMAACGPPRRANSLSTAAIAFFSTSASRCCWRCSARRCSAAALLNGSVRPSPATVASGDVLPTGLWPFEQPGHSIRLVGVGPGTASEWASPSILGRYRLL